MLIVEIYAVQVFNNWPKPTSTSLILGQTNFFLEFDVAFFRSKLEFEVNPKS
jgi:hypothetical protein